MTLCISATGSGSVVGNSGIAAAAAVVVAEWEKAEIVANSYCLTRELTGSVPIPDQIAVAAAIVIVGILEHVVEYLKVVGTTRNLESNTLTHLEHSVGAAVAVAVVAPAVRTIQSWYPCR